MIELVEQFLKNKVLAENTEKSYRYDLKQFLDIIGYKISEDKLNLYQKKISSLSASARKRKYSTVNQFLLYLYQTKQYPDYLQLSEKIKVVSSKNSDAILDKEIFYQKSSFEVGQLIALLMLELGLLPSEIALLKMSDIDLTFKVLTIKSRENLRVLTIPQALCSVIENYMDTSKVYLFEHDHQTFSRQWYFNQLSQYLKSLQLDHLSAQKLREQYILNQKRSGKSLFDLSQSLGLKSPITLEKYYKH